MASRPNSRLCGQGQCSSSHQRQHDCIQQLIGDNCVVVFGKSDCEYTQLAKQTFRSMRVAYWPVDMDVCWGGKALRCALEQLTGVQTVPQVFVNGRFIGGGSDTQKLCKNGRLQKMVAECQTCRCCSR